MTPGRVLAGKRSDRGLTIEQVAAATRIRPEHLSALESDEPGRLPAPVYAKGYLRTYARYLGLDPEPLVNALRSPRQNTRHALELGTVPGRPRLVLTTPAAAAAGLVLGVRVTDSVWLSVIVDGKSQYPDSGRILPAGSQVYFTGLDIKITSGKAAATLIIIDGHPLGALGSGMTTREFTSQTSP